MVLQIALVFVITLYSEAQFTLYQKKYMFHILILLFITLLFTTLMPPHIALNISVEWKRKGTSTSFTLRA